MPCCLLLPETASGDHMSPLSTAQTLHTAKQVIKSVPRIKGSLRHKLTAVFTAVFVFYLQQHYGIFMNAPMHTYNLHILCLKQCPGLVDQGLCTAWIHHSLVYTPLAPYQPTVCPSQTKGGCWRAGNMKHQSHLLLRTLPADVSCSPAPPTLLPWHSCSSQWVGCSLWLAEPTTLFLSPWIGPGWASSAAELPPLTSEKQLLTTGRLSTALWVSLARWGINCRDHFSSCHRQTSAVAWKTSRKAWGSSPSFSQWSITTGPTDGEQ